MAEQEIVLAKKRRGPAPTGKGQQVVVRLQPADLAALDRWIATQTLFGDEMPSRPEAIRLILREKLS